MSMDYDITGDIHSRPGKPVACSSAWQPAAGQPWRQLTQDLGRALGDLKDGQYLIVSIRGTNRFVQFAGEEAHGMLAEAVSNHYLPRGERLDDAAHHRLLQLGWWAPTHEPEESGPRAWGGSPNYFLRMERPVDHGMLASLAVGALVSVYGAKDLRQLEYKAFSRCGAKVGFPFLGLALAER
jgi:hypothetical protein